MQQIRTCASELAFCSLNCKYIVREVSQKFSGLQCTIFLGQLTENDAAKRLTHR